MRRSLTAGRLRGAIVQRVWQIGKLASTSPTTIRRMGALADIVARRVETAAMATLEAAALDLQGAAARDAPIEEGTLRGSASSRIERTPWGARAVVSFDTPYAARQHEETSYEHPMGGKAHYLSDQLKARVPRYVAALQRAVSAALRGV